MILLPPTQVIPFQKDKDVHLQRAALFLTHTEQVKELLLHFNQVMQLVSSCVMVIPGMKYGFVLSVSIATVLKHNIDIKLHRLAKMVADLAPHRRILGMQGHLLSRTYLPISCLKRLTGILWITALKLDT